MSHGSFIPVSPKTIVPLFLTMVKMSPNFPGTFLSKDTKSPRKLFLTPLFRSMYRWRYTGRVYLIRDRLGWTTRGGDPWTGGDKRVVLRNICCPISIPVSRASWHIGQRAVDSGTHHPQGVSSIQVLIHPRNVSPKGRFIQRDASSKNNRSGTNLSGTHRNGINFYRAALPCSYFASHMEKNVEVCPSLANTLYRRVLNLRYLSGTLSSIY